ncbi:glutathione S-transferase C-terminal domain-containing protein [Scleropages formosus]|uniref:Glutathione S-transferase C-terminal domain-containing protein n=1 Tax=Scleropages formosus TaxID=113540 RepID=A0A8C9WF15_SCLFO|nr:glutathione S-transferase C-terminal domain-containing protein [Scleropages formosus]XP_029114641.1 glutathione S-transferase C-terminal domain-containing protein [Scleropages formosus]
MKPEAGGLECLYLDVSGHGEESVLPLHSSIVLFVLSYCESKSFRVFLVPSQASDGQPWRGRVPAVLGASQVRRQDLPLLARSCRLPAAMEAAGGFCRAGLAVVLRHILQRACEAEPGRKDVLALLGFKKTCLKACAEVSQWTRLCELSIPLAVEEFLQRPSVRDFPVPDALLQLERKLGEPVKVHNDDKVRRQKLHSQRSSNPDPGGVAAARVADESELRAAMSKLSADEVHPPATRGPSDIRKVKTTELPQLEHVFAEGLYFTLTDLVLLPCVHNYLRALEHHNAARLQEIPLLLRWYHRVQEVPGVRRAARDCGIGFFGPQAQSSAPPAVEPRCSEEEQGSRESAPGTFVGGPRPTLTKLKEGGIEPVFCPHPCPSWTLDWDNLPAAVDPAEGKMSSVRAARKRQQLNNLVAMVTRLTRPGDTVVDFCSGGGHVGIVLAYTLPQCQVVLIENKEESLVRARSRCTALGLKNVGFVQANLDYFTGPFQIGVALHACGVATDMVLEHCIRAGAAFAVSPCCYGFVQNTLKFCFPRSKRFSDTLSYKEHMILCRFADQTAPQLPPDRRLIGKQCMGLVDLDRAWAAEASGYSVEVMTMEPESCSPKNNMLVGLPAGRALA